MELPELLPEPELVELTVVANGTGEPPLLPPPAIVLPLARPVLAEAPPPVPPVDLPKADLPKVDLPMVDLPVPPLPVAAVPPAVKPQELVPPLPAEDTKILVYRALPPGDTPMLGNWKTLALYSLMTATVAVQVPAPAAAQDKDIKALVERLDTLHEIVKKGFEGVAADVTTIKADLKRIRDDLDVVKDDGLKQRLDLANANTKIKTVELALDKIKTDLETLRSREPAVARPAVDKASVDEIKLKLGAIEQAILKLQPSTKRIALSPPTATPPTTGRVVLLNMYPEELLFVVNGKTYRVGPNSNVPLDNIAAGPLSYEVISGTYGLRAQNTVNLVPSETFTLIALIPTGGLTMIVTIDGPAGAGKSSAARLLARRLGYEFLDTGAMYRAVTLAALRDEVDVTDEQRLRGSWTPSRWSCLPPPFFSMAKM